MVKVEISLSESSSNYLDRANHALGVIKQALLDSGRATVISDNNPAEGAGVNRTIDFSFLGSARYTRMDASASGAYWQIFLSHRNLANTGYLTQSSGTIVYTNTVSAKVYLLHDAKTVSISGYSTTNAFTALKMKGTTVVHFLLPNYMYLDLNDTRYSHQATSVATTLLADGTSSLFVAFWALTDTTGKHLYALGDNYRFDNNLWCGTDRFGCTDKQMLEISTGNYLLRCNPFYIGYMA